MTPSIPELLDAKGVSDVTGLAKNTVYQYNRFGLMPEPVAVFGRSPAWSKEEIIKWNAERAQNARDDADEK